MSDEVILTLEAGVRVIRINRPKSKNAVNKNVYNIITNTLNTDADDDNVVVTIITGTGDYYSSGFDIKSAMTEFKPGSKRNTESVKLLIDALITYPKLLIAVINGPAIGIAVTTAALCDIIYASDRATFETPFLKLGLCPEGGSSVTFPNIVGRSKASEMLFLGKRLSAQEAYQFAFVSEVVPHHELDKFLNNLKKLGTELTVNSVKICKKLVMHNYKDVLCECNEREVNQLDECFVSEEFSAAIIKFMNRKSKL